MTSILAVLATVLLLVFSLVETAFGLLMRLSHRFEAEREPENQALDPYLDDPLKFFVPARLITRTLVVLITVLLAQEVGTGFTAALVLFGSVFVILLVVGQILPALIVRRSPERFLDILLPAFTVVANLLAPVTAIIVGWLVRTRRAGSGETARVGGGESADGADDGEKEGQEEERLLRAVVNFEETLVREVMTPRPDVVAIAADATVADLRQLVREQEYSRLPVYTENLDNVAGIVVVKDLIQMTAEPDETPVRQIMRPAAFVPETKRVVDLLREFQQERVQLALVVDEYGGTAGLVTVEDVVEELVGEIRDEYDSEAEPIVRESDDTFVFSAKVGIDDLTERMHVEIEDGEFETVGGFVLDRVGRVPAAGEQFELDGLDVEILEAERRRIHKVRVRRLAPTDESSTSA